MKSGANSVVSYSYDYVGNRDVTTLGNGTSTEYAYSTTDPRYLLNTITHKKGANTLATIGYTATPRDNAGNPKSMTDWTGTWDYGYDDNNRLISATPPNPVPDQPAGGDYGYDWVGNRLNPPTGSNHMVCNKADQLTSWPGMHTYTYYGDGSQHEVKTGGTTTTSYTYTPDGLLDEATYNNRTLANTWDGDKNRVSFTVASTTHNFVYDTTAGIPAVIQEDSLYYIREPGGLLIARISGANTSYYHFDALGSTRLLSDGDGDVTDRYAYDAYGSLISHDEYASSVDQPYQYVGELGYYTHFQEPEFGLLQLGVRFYDAEVGRFTQRDPVRYTLNKFAYGSDNPAARVDPSGYIDWNSTETKYYTCVAGAVLSYLGVPVDGDWADALLKHKGQKALDELIEYFSKKHAPRDIARKLYEFAREMGIPAKLRPDGNWIRAGLKWCNVIGKVWDTANLLKDLYNCQHKYYGVF